MSLLLVLGSIIAITFYPLLLLHMKQCYFASQTDRAREVAFAENLNSNYYNVEFGFGRGLLVRFPNPFAPDTCQMGNPTRGYLS